MSGIRSNEKPLTIESLKDFLEKKKEEWGKNQDPQPWVTFPYVVFEQLSYRVWQPIETAPKDGTKILISDGRKITTAYWTEEEEDYDWVEDPTQKIVYEEGWMTSDFDVGDDAIHWMPLPELPKENKDERH